MTTILFYKNGFIIKDHTNYDKSGSDLVCAGISAIVFGTINWFNKNMIVHLNIDETQPIIEFFTKLNKNAEVGLSLVKKQFLTIKKSYPKNLSVKLFNLSKYL